MGLELDLAAVDALFEGTGIILGVFFGRGADSRTGAVAFSL